MEISGVGKWIRKAVASVLFIGYVPASGTAASAVTVAALWFADRKTPLFQAPESAMGYWFVVLAMIACSMFFSSRSRELFGKEDSGRIVVDEVAGQLVVFLFVPVTIRTLITGFFLFRFFDIVKPFPVYRMEELDDGVGVTMDDVAAGVLANISLHLLLVVYHAVKSYL
ncbi:MAG: phosphatidylglycerophosphatase A [Chitinispirillaceae bacterium]|nr:phosphatidylglycerophosphatase A [Chitinispirillaceae bacterium]